MRRTGESLLFDVIVINEEYDEPGREQEIGEARRYSDPGGSDNGHGL